MIFAIDPGPKQSAFVTWNRRNNIILDYGILENDQFLHFIREPRFHIHPDHLLEPIFPVVEMIQSFGMPVGKEIFETVLLVGRIIEIFNGGAKLVYRKDIKLYFCGTNRAKDSNIRRVLIDRFGEPGTKKNPGKLYGIKKDLWSALAVAVYFSDKQDKEAK